MLLSLNPRAAQLRVVRFQLGRRVARRDLRVVEEAVIEQYMRDFSVTGEGTDLGCPIGQLFVGVAIAELLVDVVAVPFRRVTVQVDQDARWRSALGMDSQ